ncbi:prepilin peptidase [Clostridium sp. D2Q-14]|uniref:prepilin peptidase n=1 Tax=Anaeromonas gelatinilytica TaxID=2683194 RepID=UPI00193BE3B4|nr:A24 family peptidase [Anaeromonas gelatinilytica]MBS4536186.1 prepilin peptidase [Anaeromonas gelatinilytica]
MLLITILGAIIGLFLNIYIYCIFNNKFILCSQFKLRSFIPIFRYIFLERRCKHNKNKIFIQVLLVESLNGLLYLFIYLKFGLNIISIIYMILFSILIIISFVDYNCQIIPDEIIIFGIILVSIIHILHKFPISLFNGLIGVLIGGGLFLIIAIISKGGMGGGDIKLIALLGYLLGIRILMVIFLSFILGAIISIVLLVGKVKSRKDFISFGPFIAIAGVLVILFSEKLLEIYFHYILKVY